VNTADVATPLALVVAVFAPPAKAPLAPVAGAVNVTTAPLTGDPPAVTVATRGAPNARLMVWVWGVPLVAEIVVTGGFELEPLLQPIRKTRARETNARTMA
jgi:hypothetical protein